MFRRKDRRVCFEGVSKEAFGEMASGLASGIGGTFRRTVRQGFRRKFQRRHSAGLREGFERLRKGRGLSGTRVTFRKGSGRSSGLAYSKRVSGGSFEGWSSGMTLIVGLGIYG